MQSTGRWDDWRASRELLADAMAPGGIVATFGPDYEVRPTYSAATLTRLTLLGTLCAVAANEDDVPHHHYVDPAWHAEIDDVLADGPWHRAIAAILDDAHTDIVARAAGASPIEAISKQSRMIAHEVRNALVPVRHHLEELRTVTPNAQLSRLEAAKRGVVRVLGFADELVSTSELISEASSPCDLSLVTRDALTRLDHEQRVIVGFESGIRVRAPRQQLTRVMATLIQNALQATSKLQMVRVWLNAPTKGALRLFVDDPGPGVPLEHRERIFQDGFTTRTDGSGYGLAYVRRVIADELRGKVWCEASDSGGARFVIELPESLREL